jgi:hypothetical protein
MARARVGSDTKRGTAALALLLFLSLLARALVPAGYMVAAGTSGWPTLILCPGSAAQPAAAAGHHHHIAGDHKNEHGTSAESPCAFAALLAPALPPAPPIAAEPAPVPVFAPTSRPDHEALRPALAAPPPPARGPPPTLLA